MSKRKPAKIAPKRVKRPKAPKPQPIAFTKNGEPYPPFSTLANGPMASGLTFTGSTTLAPKTRVTRNTDDPRCACRTGNVGDTEMLDDGSQRHHTRFQCYRVYGIRQPRSSRWSRLWAWLDGFRWGRP